MDTSTALPWPSEPPAFVPMEWAQGRSHFDEISKEAN